MRFVTNNLNLSRSDIDQVLAQPRDYLGIDIEYVSLTNTLPLGVGIAIDRDTGFYFFDPHDPMLKEVIESSPIVLIHNASSDMPILEKLGIRIQRWEDTMLLAYANGYLEKSLGYLSENILHAPYTSVTTQWVGRSKKLQEQGNVAIDHVKMGGWCIQHACNTLALWEDLPHVDLYTDIDRPFIDLILEMEHWGLLIDQYALTKVEQQTVNRTSPMEAELKEELHVDNLNSNPQVAQALRDLGIMGTRKTKSDKDSVGEESLKPLGLPITDKLLKWRSLMKTLTTYVPAFRKVDDNGRLHTEFGYTNTGRLSSRKPNLQNITNDSKFSEEEE